MRTFHYLSAVAALEGRRIGPAGAEDEDLPAGFQGLFHMLYELYGEGTSHAPFPPFSLGVDDLYVRASGSVISLVQLYERMFSAAAVV